MAVTSSHYGNYLFFQALNEGLFCYGHSSEYKFSIMDTEGTLRRVIMNEEKPVPIGRKQKEAETAIVVEVFADRFSRKDIENAISLPAHQPFFSRLLSDDKLRIYVRRFSADFSKSDDRRDTPADYDVFSEQGIYLYRMQLPFDSDFIIKKGFLYRTVLDNDLGIYRILRYKIRNFDKMKGSR